MAFGILCFSCFSIFQLTQIKVRAFKVEHANKEANVKPHPLLLSFYTQPKGIVKAKFAVEVPSGASHEIGIRVDDCIERIFVNGKLLDLIKDLKRSSKICRSHEIQNLNLAPYLKKGLNQLVFEVMNDGGDAGIYITPPTYSLKTWIFFAMLGILFTSLLTFFWQNITLDKKELWAIWLTGLAAFSYVAKTPWDVRSHDLTGHLLYIDHVLKFFNIPLPKDCWECFQAPGYYFISAGVVALSDFLLRSSFMTMFSLQLFSLCLMFVFLYQIRKLWGTMLSPYFSFLLMLFTVSTPAFFMHAARIGNDVMSYCASLLCLAAMMSYWKEGKRETLIQLNIFLILAFLVKATALALLMSYGLLLLFVYLREIKRKSFDWDSYEAKTTVLIVSVGFALIVATYYIRNLMHTLPMSAFEINLPSAALKIKKGFQYYLFLDFSTFFYFPHADAFVVESGRDYFWNSFVKSFNLGEFRITGSLKQFLMHIRNIIIFVLIALSLYSWFHPQNRKKLYQYLPVALTSMSFIVSLMSYLWIYPYSCMSNVRVIFPFLVGFASLAWIKGLYVREFLYLSIGLGCIFWVLFFSTSQY